MNSWLTASREELMIGVRQGNPDAIRMLDIYLMIDKMRNDIEMIHGKVMIFAERNNRLVEAGDAMYNELTRKTQSVNNNQIKMFSEWVSARKYGFD